MGVTAQASPTNPELDAGRVEPTEFVARVARVPAGMRERRFQAVLRRRVLDDIHDHGRQSTDVEICGVLVGNVYHDGRGPWLHIESSIRGDAAEGQATQVTFKAETWEHIQREMETKHPDKRIVGWYHTHPGFGIFLSGMDLFIQDNFFNLPWQVAFVYDPIGGDEGSFVWRGGKSEREPFLVDESITNEESWELATATSVPASGARSNELTPIEALDAKLGRINPSRTWVVTAVLLVVACVLAGLAFALFTGAR